MDTVLYIALLQTLVTLYFLRYAQIRGAFKFYLNLLIFLPLLQIVVKLYLVEIHGVYILAYGYAFPTLFLFGPLTFLLTKNVHSDYRIRARDILHFVPFGAAFTYAMTTLYFYLEMRDLRAVELYTAIVFPGVLLSFAVYGILINVFGRRTINGENFGEQAHRTRLVNRISLLLMVYPLATGILYHLEDFALYVNPLGYLLVTLEYLFIVNYLYCRKPATRSGGHRNGALDSDPLLEEVEMSRILKVLDTLVTGEKIYRDRKLKLSRLARDLDLPVYKISHSLNYTRKMNFKEYINSFRVEEAKEMLVTHVELSIDQVLVQTGFNSRSTFYRAFREKTGMTPIEYRKKIGRSS